MFKIGTVYSIFLKLEEGPEVSLVGRICSVRGKNVEPVRKPLYIQTKRDVRKFRPENIL